MVFCLWGHTTMPSLWNHDTHTIHTTQYWDLMTDINSSQLKGRESVFKDLKMSSLPSACTTTAFNSAEELVYSFSVQTSLFFSFLPFLPFLSFLLLLSSHFFSLFFFFLSSTSLFLFSVDLTAKIRFLLFLPLSFSLSKTHYFFWWPAFILLIIQI